MDTMQLRESFSLFARPSRPEGYVSVLAPKGAGVEAKVQGTCTDVRSQPHHRCLIGRWLTQGYQEVALQALAAKYPLHTA